MSTKNNRFTLRYDRTKGNWRVEDASDNPLYNQDIVTATELARLDVIDKGVTEWTDCEDADAIWQKMVDSRPK